MNWNDIYQRNKVLDTHFEQKYLANHIILKKIV